MADNIELDSGSGGATVATDDIGGVHYQINKVAHGALETATLVTSAAGLPVTPDSSGFEVKLSATDNAVLDTIDAVLDTINAKLVGANVIGDVNAIQSGTWTIDLGTNNDVTVQGEDAENAAAAANPVQVGGRYDATPRTLGDGDVGAIALDADGAVHITDGGNAITVDAASLPLPTGAATETTLDAVKTAVEGTIAVSNAGLTELAAAINVSSQMDVNLAASSATVTVDGSGVTQPVSDTNTTNIPNVIGTDGSAGPTSALSVAGTESGGNLQELRVDADGHLQVDILSGGGSNASVFADDAAFTLASDSVTVGGGIRDDELSTLTAVEGDAVPLRVSSTGALHVTGGGGGTEYTVDAAAPAAPTGSAVLMERDDAITSLTEIEGDWTNFRGTAEGALWVQDFNSDAILVDTGTIAGDTTSIDGKMTDIETNTDFGATTGNGTATGALRVTVASDTTGVISVDDNGANLSVDLGGTAATLNSGTVDAGTQRVVLATDVALPAGTNAIGKLAANSGVDIGDVDILSLPASTNTLEVVGDVAHDAAAAGNPVLIAGRATNSIEGLTQVAAADSTFLTTDLNGVAVVRPHTTPEEHISERISNTNGTSTNFTNFAAGGAGVHNYVCDVTITNTSATDAYVDLRDGSAGSVIWTFPAPANSGATHSFSLPLKGAANTALAYDVSAAITTMYVCVNGFQAQG